MTTAPTTAPTALRQDVYSYDKQVVGGITVVTMHGTLNEAFEGRKLAQSIRTKKALVQMYDVRRFASWGMSEWMDFLRVTAECDVYLVECSTYAVSQLNLVTGLLGQAKLVSFYASYRCSTCSEEMETRFIIPRDRAIIPDIPNTTQDCPTCGGRARLEEYPAAFFDTIAARPPFDIDDDVLAYLRAQLGYDLSPDLAKFRAYRSKQKDYTYVRLSGNMATMPGDVVARACSGTTVLDLENAVHERSQLAPWRTFLDAALGKLKALQLLGCPAGFLEAAVHVDELQDKLKVRSFAMPFHCGTCDTTTPYTVDVAANLEQLAMGIVPAGRCISCRSALTPVTTEELIAIMRALPARDRDVDLDKFLAKAQSEPIEKLENCLTIAAPKPTAPEAPRGGKGPWIAGAAAAVLLGAGGVAAWQTWGRHTAQPAQVTPPPAAIEPPIPTRPAFTRPDWITSDVPGSGYCREMTGRLVCVGVSSYHVHRDDGVGEASDAALEELVNTLGLKISDPYFRDMVAPAYSAVRAKALAALQSATLNRTSDPKAASVYQAAADAVAKSRHRVVTALQATGGPAVPAQRADWYWEEYAPETGEQTEFLVFVRFDISEDGVKALVDKYSQATDVLGGSVVTAFPALAWQHAAFTGGALVVKPGPKLAKAGIAPQDLVVGIGKQPVTDASGLLREVEAAKGELKLAVVTGDGAERTVSARR